MRWRMCPKDGVKMSMEISETGFHIYHCHICKQRYMEFQGELLKYIENMDKKDNKDIDEFMEDVFKVLDEMERKINEQDV